MKRSRNPELRRQNIIEATQRLLRLGGYHTRFSLDAVAKEAGVSKGGLMHHFASKDALLRAVALDTIAKFEASWRQLAAQEPAGSPGRLTRAYINVVLGAEDGNAHAFSPILLSYVRDLDGVGETRFEYWHARLAADGLDSNVVTMVRMAVDGLLYTEMIDNRPVDPIHRQQLRTTLLELVARNIGGHDVD